uniref:Uncharacterized protein n=1 Tax=Anopheles darlingi TaxID=43151 RepID=A0A2M4DPF5_ANODA
MPAKTCASWCACSLAHACPVSVPQRTNPIETTQKSATRQRQCLAEDALVVNYVYYVFSYLFHFLIFCNVVSIF